MWSKYRMGVMRKTSGGKGAAAEVGAGRDCFTSWRPDEKGRVAQGGKEGARL